MRNYTNLLVKKMSSVCVYLQNTGRYEYILLLNGVLKMIPGQIFVSKTDCFALIQKTQTKNIKSRLFTVPDSFLGRILKS